MPLDLFGRPPNLSKQWHKQHLNNNFFKKLAILDGVFVQENKVNIVPKLRKVTQILT